MDAHNDARLMIKERGDGETVRRKEKLDMDLLEGLDPITSLQFVMLLVFYEEQVQ